MGTMQMPTEKVWDRHAIKAEIERKGHTLTSIATAFGMPAQTVRNALDKPSRSGELAIAKFLGMPVHQLFPDRWTSDNKRIYPRCNKINSAGEV